MKIAPWERLDEASCSHWWLFFPAGAISRPADPVWSPLLRAEKHIDEATLILARNNYRPPDFEDE